MLGRTTASAQFVSMAMMPLAPVLGGGALSLLGGRGAMVALGALCAVVAMIPTSSREVRSVPRPEVWRARGATIAPQPDLARRSAA
ncbi:MAG: transporter [Marmoricola sp.]|nr:transporter [Marmoricola sp.]